MANARISGVVYLLIPTSNHNLKVQTYVFVYVVYLLIPTSNHNEFPRRCEVQLVVYLLIPTSNHNNTDVLHEKGELYIFWFLHQTTTQ